MGIAVLDGEELIYHGVKTFSRGRSPHEALQRARMVIARLLADFKPTVLAIEKAFIGRNRSAALLNVFVDEIQYLGKRAGLQVVALAPSTVKKRVTGNGHATKEEIAKAVVARYPELKVYLSQDRKWKESFHANMFDAVAVGLAAVERS